MALEDDMCVDPVHRKESVLFGAECNDCGSLMVFADDSLIIHSSNIRTLNQERIDGSFLKIRDFLNSNGLQINEGKTFLTEYMTKQKRGRLRGVPPSLSVTVRVEDKDNRGIFRLEDKTVEDSSYSRTLGLNLQNTLSWEAHLTKGKKAVLPSARKQLGRLFKLRDSLSTKLKLLLVNSLVLSKITYVICLWDHGTSNHLRQAQILLNQAGIYVTGMDRTARSTDIMLQCDWLNIRELASYHTLIQFYKTVKWGAPTVLRARIEVDDNLLIATERPRLLLTQGAYRVRATPLWNNLPDYLRMEMSLSKFKVLLKRWLKERRNSEDDHDEMEDLENHDDLNQQRAPVPGPVGPVPVPGPAPDPGPGHAVQRLIQAGRG